MKIISEQTCFDGVQGFYKHASGETGTLMRFAVYQPPQARTGSVPVLYYLAGLTCTEETATIKAGAQRLAAEHGLMLVMPDTSPRGAGIDGEDDDWDFGTGAGFYLDATAAPWSKNYRMYSYITQELPELIAENFPVKQGASGIFGHSMGGHGALTIALKNPESYRSVSAFAPICAPTQCPWGEKAFGGYLGSDREKWSQYDATELVQKYKTTHSILIDQGKTDNFLAEQLKPHLFEAACQDAGQKLTLRQHVGYD
jgi:S-formylglutathione hydrolase